ncbi:unnamed protein product [Rhizopus stolonifer]
MCYQFFNYLEPMMEDENTIGLAVSDHAKWSSIDMTEELVAICKLSEAGQKKNHTLFQFTPSKENYTTTELVNAANEGLEHGMT